MLQFILRRLMSMGLVLFAVSVLTFLIFNVIPNNDPAVRMAGRQARDVQIQAIRKEWGFDKSLPQQYAITMKKVLTGDLKSYVNQTDVVDEIIRRAPRTFLLALGAGILWMIAAVGIGLYTAMRAGKVSDKILTALAMLGISMPVFWLGAVVNYYLGFKAGLFPNGGYVPFTENPLDWFYHMIMPWTVLAVLFIGVYSRVLRSNILDTINDDYVRTARAKGISERRVLLKHVLRNSLIPIVTLWGLDLALLLGGGAILTESVFSIDGVGQYVANATSNLDVPPVLAVTIFAAFFVVLLNTIVDIVYAALDPRIRAK